MLICTYKIYTMYMLTESVIKSTGIQKHIDPILQIVSNYACGLKNRTSAYNGYSNSVGARFTFIDGEGVNSRPFKAHQRSFPFSGHCIRIQPIRFKAIIKGQGVYATL